ncbi:hypothetical protein LUZ61_008581 [Rhynchospora tenuis]|uniref:Reverse transcriptase n=1 Tax=Rhynchospora tenuis TaxID=198213 RepID=A0AAD6EXJ7_9POAL|nr:hypothetical protein LUZ61_008581 [Rhynchospora tenuis]
MPPKVVRIDQGSEGLQETVDRLNVELQQANSRIEQQKTEHTQQFNELKAMMEQFLKNQAAASMSSGDTTGTGKAYQTPPRGNPNGTPNFTPEGFGSDDGKRIGRGSENRVNLPKTDFPSFNGNNPIGWKSKCESYFHIFQIPEMYRTQLATLHFEEEAQEWYDCFKEDHPNLPWPILLAEVLDRFKSYHSSYPVGDFKRVHQEGKVAEYIRQFEKAKSRLIAETKINSSCLFIQGFLEGLKEEIRYAVEVLNPITLNQAFNYARKIELNLESMDKRITTTRAITYPQNHFAKKPMNLIKAGPTTPSSSGPLVSKEMTREQMRALRLCYYCKENYVPGHKCKMKSLHALQLEPPNTSMGDNLLYAADQPMYIEWITGEEQLQENTIADHAVITMCTDHKSSKFQTLKFKGTLDDTPICVLIDTGSTHSFVNPTLIDYDKWPVSTTVPLHVRIANGTTMSTDSQCDQLHFTLKNHAFQGTVRLLNIQGYDLILGMDWLSLHGPMMIDWEGGKLQLHKEGKAVELLVQQEVAEVHLCQEALDPVKECQKGHIMMVAHICEIQDENTMPVKAVCPQLQLVLDRFTHVFQEPTKLPPSRSIDHQIILKPETKPISIRPYRYSYFQRMEIEKIIEDLIKNSFIRPSTSPFSSPVLLVKKKDGSWRLCIDYRQLNDATVKNKYPIPIIDDLLDELKGASYFSKIDLRSGYHQIRMADQDSFKTAFRTHNGHFEFMVMPFGLTNAPATFQTLMNNLFKPYLRQFILVFFNDILIYSKTLSDHISHVCTTLQVLADNNLFAKLSKCEFGVSQIEYLGHIISEKGVATDPHKIEAMSQWPVPKTVKQLRGFLGLTGYYRKFIQHYGTIAKPLTELTKKNAFKWSPLAQSAFEQLKKAMTEAPVLVLPDYSQQFVIETDASALGMGAVLMQSNRPIAFLSKSLGVKNQGLSTYEKELLALLTAVKKWRHYLLGQPFVIRTDQISLKHLLEQKITSTLQHKSLCVLLGLDYTIEYKKGKENKAADALSRVQGQNWQIDALPIELAAVSEIVPSWIQELTQSYQGDPWIEECRQKAVMATADSNPTHTTHLGVLRYKGRLCVGNYGEWRTKVLQSLHDSSVGGHSGINATYHKVKKFFYWPNLKQAIHDYVTACHTCQLNKGEHIPYPGLLQPLPIPPAAWHSVGLDFITGLPKSCGKDVILVVIDRFTKYGHFLPLTHPYSASTVAQLFLDNIYKLHGLPQNLVSDRDPIFTSQFWREIMDKIGIQLNLSTAYHPQSDGQTERLNQCVEQYLRCMIFDQQKKWVKWLPLAEYWYNTCFHQSLGMTPFQALYGYSPALLPLGDVIRSSDQAVNTLLSERQRVLGQIKNNLIKAQSRMKKYADLHRSERHFQVGDWVYMRVQPYRQQSVQGSGNMKLNSRYFGPFEILEKVGQVAYKLNLPASAQIHPVIHVSQLKKQIGRRHVPSQVLPWLGADGLLRVEPECILNRRMIKRGLEGVVQLQIKWMNLPESEATWEDYELIKTRYPEFLLEVENSLMEGEMSGSEATDNINIKTSLIVDLVKELAETVSSVEPFANGTDGSITALTEGGAK